MKRVGIVLRVIAMAGFLAGAAGCRQSAPAQGSAGASESGETLVMLRHGEKPLGGLGQLSCKGLNRALALPQMLIGRYGKPDFIFAPNPSVEVQDGVFKSNYSYIRPLATIEPTAIRLGMPVNAQIGFNQINDLQKELLKPEYAHAVVFVAWEHVLLRDFARQLLQAYGEDPDQVKSWPSGDFDTIYVVHLTRTGNGGRPHATFEVQQEGLTDTLSDTCPGGQ